MFRFLLFVLMTASALAARAQGPPTPAVDPALYQAMEWRNIGPFRGGRVTAVAGVPGDPLVYYMGATGGGVWKTEDAGLSWRNVSDGFIKTGSVGAIAVAELDPNVVYVGMGEAPVRGVATSHGDGVYRSTDAGRTWTHVGLEKTRHISTIAVHPRDPDLVYVAAQGSPFGPNPERGIYRSADAGATWTLVHTVNDTTGASDLSMDMANPRILYAAYWDHQRLPWRVRSGGPGSGVFKTTDGGATWRQLTSGLPRSVMGKVAVSVSRARPDRVYALVEAEDGGLFRSDDGGETWTLVNEERVLRTRAWYYINVFADPGDPDTVYVLNAPMLRSIDAGRTFTTVPTPHGDNHGLWINPRNPRWMINGNDGGANVSLDGGRGWSTQANQPTAQFYRVNTDARAPYWVYGGQQDNTTVAIPSRTNGPGIAASDWHPVGGCESAYVAFNPAAPDTVYAGCYQGIISEWSRGTGTTRNVMAYASLGLGEPSNEQKYRFNWNAPIVVSRHNPAVIYHGGNRLFRSENRGNSWTAVSPDLTRNDPATQGPGGAPITNEGAGGEVYNTIFAVAESPHDARTLWVGTDDGLVHVTRDGGGQWSNVTPKGMGEFQVNAIEVSPHDPSTVYLAVTGYKRNDFTPHAYKTRDGGRTWERLVAGLPDGSFVRVVREDPVRRDLLYAGTETGAHVSFDGGRAWQSLQLNLPVVPVTDLQVREGDLVASTQGRAFWILDDLSPLRAAEAGLSSRALHLLAPSPAVLWPGTQGPPSGAGALGRNAPAGAVFYYTLAKAPAGNEALTLEVRDAAGRVVRRLTSAAPPPPGPGAPPTPRLPAAAGLNRFVWDLRAAPIGEVPGQYINGNLQGYRVGPGTYRVRIAIGSQSTDQPLQVRPDPRAKLTEGSYTEQQALLAAIHARVAEIHRRVVSLRDLRDQAKAIVERNANHPQAAAIREVADTLVADLTAWEDQTLQSRQKTFQDVINFRNLLNAHYLYVAEELDDHPTVTDGIRARLKDLDAAWAARDGEWQAILTEAVPAFTAALARAGVGTVVVKP